MEVLDTVCLKLFVTGYLMEQDGHGETAGAEGKEVLGGTIFVTSTKGVSHKVIGSSSPLALIEVNSQLIGTLLTVSLWIDRVHVAFKEVVMSRGRS